MEIQDLYPLSPLQQGMLFHELYAPESGMYVERLRYTIRGDLNIEAFERAWRQVVESHPILRSAFIWEEVDEPLQAVFGGAELPLEVLDWRAAPPAEQEERLQAHLAEVLLKGFNLSRAPLMRLTLIRMSDDVSEFIWSYHHLLLDGWSVSLVLGEIITLYEAFCRGEKPQLEKSRPYRDYIAWLKRQDQAEAEAFWRKTLKGFTTPISLSMNGANGDVAGRQDDYESSQIHLSKETAEKLDAFARRRRLTVNTVAQGAWALLLSRYTGQQDVVFGAVVSGRPVDLAGAESMVGMFINTAPVRAQAPPDAFVLPWLENLQAKQIEARRYEYIPLVKAQEWSEATRGTPLFESIVVFENPTMGVRLGHQEGSPEITYSTHYATVTGYPLTVVIEPGPAGVSVGITYDRRRFEADVVRRMQALFQTLLEGILADPERRLSDLPLLAEAERRRTLVEWNETRKTYPEDKRLHHLFEAQVERTPNAVAVVFEEEKLTYRELNARANQLARYLRARGVGPESLVGVCLDRSLEMMVAILGVLKAGGAYVPLDPAYPKERLDFMLEDSQASVLLTQRSRIEDRGSRIEDRESQSSIFDLRSSIFDLRCQVVCLDEIAGSLGRESAENFDSGATADNAAYVIYTSGSTGRPKGVIVSSRAVVNHMLWLRDHFALNAGDSFLQKTPLSFDAAGTEFFAPLIVGAHLIIAQPGGHRDGAYLARMITGHGVTILQLVPSLLRALLDEPEFANCHSLRRVICAGEALPAELQERFRACLDAELHNFYGPTEAAIDVTYWPHQHAVGRAVVPIGRPIANTRIYLLSGDLRPVPEGAPGELYIGGENLARGYLNRPELTAASFIPDPFGSEPGARLYKTGDLARYMPDGNIEFLGRVDHQVKVRGFRIELGEIEAALNQHPAVRESMVVVQDDKLGNKRLGAFVVSDPATGLSSEELREFIKAKLPEYMTPAAFALLEALPLTPNGKVDRRALPALNGSGPNPHDLPDLSNGFAAPRNKVEEVLAGIWAQVLGVKRVGIHDNFFEMGGDSILSIQVVGKANQQGLRVTPRQIFQHPTIAELSTAPELVDTSAGIQAEQELVTGPAPLTPIQHWFFEQNLPEPHHWNHAILLETRQAVDATLLEKAVGRLLAHHDALRLRFELTDSGWRQTIAGWNEEDRGSRIEDRGSRIEDCDSRSSIFDLRSSAPFTRFDLTGLPESEQSAAIEARAAELQMSLNLSQGPLLRVAFFDLGPERTGRLLILIHHLAVDGVAWRILLEDLMTAYQQLSLGEGAQLPPKTTSFGSWARRLAEFAQTPELKREMAYWLAQATSPPLPVDYPEGRSSNTEASARVVSDSLTIEETRALLQEVSNAYRTQINDVLLTALAQAFSQWTGERALLVDLEGHGRETLFDDVDLSRTVGWFTTIFPALLTLESEQPGEALKSVKEQLRAVPNHGVGYGLLRYLSGDEDVAARLRQAPQAEVSFNYLGQFDQLLPEGAPFGPAMESVGPSHSPRGMRRYPLEINAFISGARLQLEWTYSERIHRRETIEHLAQSYSSALRALIAHCLSVEAGGYTPSDFPLAKLGQAKLDWLTGADRGIEDIYPLSPAQEGMLFYTLLTPESGAYVTQMVYEMEGLNVEAMKRAWQRVLDRHPILRTAFVWKNLDNPLQIVRRRVDLRIDEEDWRKLSAGGRKERIENFLKADQRRGFHLSQAPLMRMTLFRVADDNYRLVWSYHHLLLDGWSAPLLIKEFLSFYEAFDKGQDLQPARSRPYRDYIEWLDRQDLSAAEAFWRRFLKGFTSPTPLGTNHPAPGGGYAEQEVWLDEAMTASLHSFARKHKLTLNTLSQAVWSLMLSHNSGGKDVVFGATVSGRPLGLPGSEAMIGLFINTLPLRARITPDVSLTHWLRELQDQQAEMLQYESSPLNEVQRWSEVPQDKPLFESIVVFENFPMDGARSFKDRGLNFVNTDFVIRNNFPLTLRVVPGSQLLLKILYDASRFDADGIAGMLAQLETLLRKIIAQPDCALAELVETLAEADRRRRSMKEEEFKATRLQKLQSVKRKAMGSAQSGGGSEG
jgi:amino acid adenylation domain-containing protein/non-ribosomal peptide synthase protein (TIGR01720 family)